MGLSVKNRLAALCVWLVVCCLTACGGTEAADTVPGLEELAAMTDADALETLSGCVRSDVLAAWGEPDGGLSGLFGDIYELENGDYVIVYYDTEPMNEGTADGRTVPVEYVRTPSPDKEETAS